MFRILVIDDSVDMLKLMYALFHGEGFTVITASNGEEALDRIEEFGFPNLILVDFYMETMNGPDFLALFHRLYPDEASRIPVVMITGKELHEIVRLPVDKMMSKPVNLRKLLDFANQYLH